MNLVKIDTSKLIVLLGVFGISLSAILSRLAPTVPSLSAAMYRMLFTSILMLPVVLVCFRGELLSLGYRDIFFSALSGVFLGIHFSSYFESLKYTSIAAATVLVDTEVLVVAVVLLLVFREKIPRKGLIGIGLAFIGSIVIASIDMKNASGALYGDVMALVGSVASAVYTLIGRRERKTLSTAVYTFLVYSFAAVTLFIAALITGTKMTGFTTGDYLAVLGMVVFCTFCGHTIFSFSLGRVSAAFVSVSKLGEPVCASLMGLLIFGEIPKPNQLLGGIIIIIGILFYLFAQEPEK